MGYHIQEGGDGEQYITRSVEYVLGQSVMCHECGKAVKHA